MKSRDSRLRFLTYLSILLNKRCNIGNEGQVNKQIFHFMSNLFILQSKNMKLNLHMASSNINLIENLDLQRIPERILIGLLAGRVGVIVARNLKERKLMGKENICRCRS